MKTGHNRNSQKSKFFHIRKQYCVNVKSFRIVRKKWEQEMKLYNADLRPFVYPMYQVLMYERLILSFYNKIIDSNYESLSIKILFPFLRTWVSGFQMEQMQRTY